MTKNQAEWASQHDWYRGCSILDNEYTVYCKVWVITGPNQGEWESASFTSLQELRKWAGY